MAAIATFDTLKLARRLREAGMPAAQAEAIAEAEAEVLSDFVLSHLATKGDVAEIKTEIADLRSDIAEVRAELKEDIANLDARITSTNARIDALRAELKEDIASTNARIDALRAELKEDIAELRGELGRFEARFERLDRKYTLSTAIILFAIVFLNQDALAFLARLFGLMR